MTPRDVALSVCSEDEDPRVVALVERAVREDRARQRPGRKAVAYVLWERASLDGIPSSDTVDALIALFEAP